MIVPVEDAVSANPVLCLTGPTAAGKTAAACALYDALDCRLISLDSAQIYRGMTIGTAKPDAVTLQRYPHALIDIRDPEQHYNVAEFCRDAKAEIEAAHRAGQLPVLVGGTTMYLQTLLRGLDDLPAADRTLRANLTERAQQQGWPALHRQLQQLDPVTARQIEPQDAQRIQRALEVYISSGKPMSQLQTGAQPGQQWRWLQVVVAPLSRETLHQRITQRVYRMLADGLVAEVDTLVSRPNYDSTAGSLRSVGYRQTVAMLQGEMDQQQLPAAIITATRQLAKRQLTWLRQQPGMLWIDVEWPGLNDFLIKRSSRFSKGFVSN